MGDTDFLFNQIPSNNKANVAIIDTDTDTSIK